MYSEYWTYKHKNPYASAIGLNVYAQERVGSSYWNVVILSHVLALPYSPTRQGPVESGSLCYSQILWQGGVHCPLGDPCELQKGSQLTRSEGQMLTGVCAFCLLCGVPTGLMTTQHFMPAKMARIFLTEEIIRHIPLFFIIIFNYNYLIFNHNY